MNPDDRKYSKEHEWIKLEESPIAILGVTHFAQDQLGDLVYLDLPAAGTRLAQFAKLGEVESVKAVNDLYSPITGEVLEVNQVAVDNPEIVNEDPTGRGWLLRVRIEDAAELDNLLTAKQYEAFLAETSH